VDEEILGCLVNTATLNAKKLQILAFTRDAGLIDSTPSSALGLQFRNVLGLQIKGAVVVSIILTKS